MRAHELKKGRDACIICFNAKRRNIQTKPTWLLCIELYIRNSRKIPKLLPFPDYLTEMKQKWFCQKKYDTGITICLYSSVIDNA